MSSGPGSDPSVTLPTSPLFVFPASARPSMNPHKVWLGWLSGPVWKEPDQQERQEDSDHLCSGALSKHNSIKTQSNPSQPGCWEHSSSRKLPSVPEEKG